MRNRLAKGSRRVQKRSNQLLPAPEAPSQDGAQRLIRPRLRAWSEPLRQALRRSWCRALGCFKDTAAQQVELGSPKHLSLIRVHDLRHTCATMLLSKGVHPKVVQELLGHGQISLTLDTYSHVLPTMQEEAARTLEQVVAV